MLRRILNFLFGRKTKVIESFTEKSSMFQGGIKSKIVQDRYGNRYQVSYGKLKSGYRVLRRGKIEHPNWVDGREWSRPAHSNTLFRRVIRI